MVPGAVFNASRVCLQVDIGPYLSGTSEAFKAYIDRGISRIKARHDRGAGAERPPANAAPRGDGQNMDGWRHGPEGKRWHFAVTQKTPVLSMLMLPSCCIS